MPAGLANRCAPDTRVQAHAWNAATLSQQPPPVDRVFGTTRPFRQTDDRTGPVNAGRARLLPCNRGGRMEPL